MFNKSISFCILIFCLSANVNAQNIPHANFTAPWGVQVNTFNGNIYLQRSDLTIPGQGLSIDLSFAFNSFRDTIDRGYGKGWLCTYSMEYFSQNADTMLLERADGRVDVFAKINGVFKAPKGIFDQWLEYEPGKFSLRTRHGMAYYFDNPSHKKLTHIADTNGNAIQLGYNANGELVAVTDAAGRSVSLSRNSGHLSGITDGNFSPQRQTSYAYNADGQLVLATDFEGGTMGYGYNDQGWISTMTNERGDELKILYEESGAVSDVVTCIAHVNFKYNPAQGKTYVTERNQGGDRTTIYDYDDAGKLLQKTGACCGYNTIYQYDDDNNVALLSDANSNQFTASHDNRGNALLATDPTGASQQLAFEPSLNRLTSLTDKKGNTTAFEYDAKGNLTKINQPEAVANQFGYDANGNLLSLTDGNQHQTVFQYNANSDVAAIQYPIGSEAFLYDNVGNLTQSTDGNGNAVFYAYDKLNRLKSIKDTLDNEVLFTYDAASNLTQETDAEGHPKLYGYDAHQRLSSVTTPAGVTYYAYDANDNLIQITDANGHVTVFSYNTRNLLTEEKDPLGNKTVYAYDGNGNVLARTDANGHTTAYTYDALNRLTSKVYDGNADYYEYDPNGNLTACSNNHISLSFKYDGLNRLKEKTVNNWNKTIRYEYDGAGNRTKMTDPEDGVTNYEYDDNNRLTKITNPLGQQTLFAYDTGGRLLQQVHGNGLTTTFEYDAANRLTKLSNTNNGGNPVSSYAYMHDKNGNRISMVNESGGGAIYDYDGDNRLKEVNYINIPATDQAFEFDSTGNRTKLYTSAGVTTYTFDKADRLLTAGNSGYAFDANGNMVEKTDANGQKTRYHYDGENRLTQVELPNGNLVNFQYDPFGNRISQETPNGTIHYFLDGDNVLMELDASGSTLARYTAGLALDSWISMDRGGQTYYYQTDGLGSVTALTDASQAVVATYLYDAYGNIVAQTGSIENPYTYTGREFDAATGLYYYRTRYYDAGVGRFLTRDGFRGFRDEPSSMNKYVYVINNPINEIDPKGLNPMLIGIAWNLFSQLSKNNFNIYCVNWAELMLSGLLKGPINAKQWASTIAEYALDFLPVDAIDKITSSLIDPNVAANLEKKWFSSLKKSDRAFYNRLKRERGNRSYFKRSFHTFLFKYFLEKMLDITDLKIDKDKCNMSKGSQDDSFGDFIGPIPPPPALPDLLDPDATIPIIRSKDPNEILPPNGCGLDKWVAKSATLPYTILFENDPDFATAPAQLVTIEQPLDPQLQPESFRLGDFGFGSYYFTVPANVSFYNAQLDLSDSLGVLLDVVAGVNVTSNPPKAFWFFESKDPATGLSATLPANLGFLPVNDSLTHIGEGFVNFTLRAKPSAVTYDTLHARASITFDDNPPIETNLAYNLVDADLPSSHITGIETLPGEQYKLTWAGADIGSGIVSYTLYVSENGGPFLPQVADLTGNTYNYQGTTGSNYGFFLIATDCAGNVEPLKNGAETGCALSLALSQTPAVNGQATGSASVAIMGSTGTASYLWSNNATTATIQNLLPGTYSVTVTDDLGCAANGSITVENSTGTSEQMPVSGLLIQRIYPVPAGTSVQVEFFSPVAVVFMEIYTAEGKKLSGRTLEVKPGQMNTASLDVSGLAAGSYLLKVRTRDGGVSGVFLKG